MSRPIGLEQAQRYVRALIVDAGCEGRVEMIDLRNCRKHFVATLRGAAGEGTLTLSHNVGTRKDMGCFRRKNMNQIRRLAA